jgi:hypothetical protein
VMFAALIAFATESACAQQVAVQQPVVGITSVNTSVLVPDRGQIRLGGVSSAQSSRNQYGFWPRGSGLGLSRSANSLSASVTIIDLREMDEAILSSGPSSSANRSTLAPSNALEVRSPTERSPSEKAAHFERLALRAEEQGRFSVAKLHWTMAAKFGSLAAKERFTDEPGQPFDHPPLAAISLSLEKPSELMETAVIYRGTTRRYGQIRYGTSNSLRVTVVVDQRENRDFDLYVDANRNFQIEPKELVAGEGALRRMRVAAEIRREDEAEHLPRSVLFRRGVTWGALGFATAGYLEGQARIGERTMAFRRVDGDGNGFFTDARDRLWLDLDGNGDWDAFNEQLPLLPVLKIREVRYAVRSDLVGTSLRFEPITGEGKIRLACRPAGENSQVADLFVMLIGSDGSAISLRCGDEAVAVPVGKYALETVTLAVRTGADGLPWNFTFGRRGNPADHEWHAVAPDETVAIDPVGKLRFQVVANEGKPAAPGQEIRIQPQLVTHDGLIINSCSLGTNSRNPYSESSQALINLVSASGSILQQAQSGFA